MPRLIVLKLCFAVSEELDNVLLLVDRGDVSTCGKQIDELQANSQTMN